jgi:hypothetical protein
VRAALVVVRFDVLEELAVVFRFVADFDFVAAAAFAEPRFLVWEPRVLV